MEFVDFVAVVDFVAAVASVELDELCFGCLLVFEVDDLDLCAPNCFDSRNYGPENSTWAHWPRSLDW